MTNVDEKVKNGKKKEKVVENVEMCENCKEDDVDLEVMPCCGKLLCWDYCLYEMPDTCPLCGAKIFVELKDPMTKEAYVTLREETFTPVEVKCQKCGSDDVYVEDTENTGLMDKFIEIIKCRSCDAKAKVEFRAVSITPIKIKKVKR